MASPDTPLNSIASADDAESTRLKTEYLAGISHQIRTPLNGVLALADLLSKQPLAGDAPAYVRTIRDSVEHVVGVLTEAIDLYRAECVGLELAPEPTALRPLMDDVQALWMGRAQQAGVTLNVSFEGAPEAAVLVDAHRVKQVFGNLVGNALRFTRRGGVEASLRVVTHGARAHLQGVVRDTGPGIAADKIASVFEPFVTGTRGEHSDQTGLGLSIARQIVTGMGGRIWAEPNTGVGAAFIFEFECPAAEIVQPQSEDASPRLRGHVLVVDDNATNRIVAETLCEMLGCSTESVADGAEAVEAARHGRFDAVLMDIRMPNMDGVQATRAIRALSGPEGSVPIVALTAQADPEDIAGYMAAGMGWVVEKPIKAEALFAALAAALSGPAAGSIVAAA